MVVREVTMKFQEGFNEIAINTIEQVHKAIGYLITWAVNSDSERYKGKMTLFGDDNGDLHAAYHNQQGEVTYTIFGQRDEQGHYTFHS